MLSKFSAMIVPTREVYRQASRTFVSQATSGAASTGCPHHVGVDAGEVDWDRALPFKEIPGPSKFELIKGFMPGGAYYKKPVSAMFNDLRRRYGEFVFVPGMFGNKSIIMTFDPDIFRTVFRNEGIWPARRNFDSMVYFRQVLKKDYFQGVEGLIMTSGEPWGKFRSAVNPILMQPKNARQYLNKMLPVNRDFLQRIRDIRNPNTLEMPADFDDEINRLTFESVACIALDQDLGLIRRNRDSPEAKTIFHGIREIFDLAFDLDFKPSLWKLIKTPKFRRMMKVNEDMFNITRKYIEDSLSRIEQHPHTENESELKSVVEKLAEKNKIFAIVMAMDLLMAGVEATTTSLVGILFGIAKNADKQEKLRQEIGQILPDKDAMPTLEQMQNLPYLRACIKEGIRMYPFGPGTVRTIPKNIVLNGYQIPEGTDIAMGNNVILDEEKYFPQPSRFIPERWLRTAEAEAYKPEDANPFVYLPFGFGPRSCAGKRIAELEMELTIMRLVRNFDIEFNYSLENAFSTLFITRPAIPLKFKFTELEN